MDREERVSVVQAIFSCDAQDAQQLADSLRLVKFDRSATIAFQGDDARDCQFVVSGSVGLRALGSEGQYTQLATVEPGEVFGSFPSPGLNAAEAVAQDSLEMLVISSVQLGELSRNHAAIASGLAGLFAGQLANVLGRLAARVTLSARGRVNSELLAMADDQHKITPVPVVSALAIKAQTSRETASRAISALERRGVIERGKSSWQIAAPRMLEDMVY